MENLRNVYMAFLIREINQNKGSIIDLNYEIFDFLL